RPDSKYVVFEGLPHASPAQEVSGKVVINACGSIKVKQLRLDLIRRQKVSWPTQHHLKDKTILTKRAASSKKTSPLEHVDLLPLAESGSYKLSRGAHELPFSFTLPGDTEESIEGHEDWWNVYELRATLVKGPLGRTVKESCHLRVIRTQGDEDWVPVPYTVQNHWTGKCIYDVLVPNTKAVMGGKMEAEFTVTLLNPALEIIRYTASILEQVQLFCSYDSGYRPDLRADHVAMKEKSWTLPEDSKRTNPDDLEFWDVERLENDGHRFKCRFDLPNNLRECRQTADIEDIRVRHKLILRCYILNPEGHTSALEIKIPIHLFISPILPPNDDHRVPTNPDLITSAAEQVQERLAPPPTYGERHLDILFSGIDPDDFLTPMAPGSAAASGTNTPFLVASRATSSEHLPLAMPEGRADTQQQGEHDVDALVNRLDALQRTPLAQRDFDLRALSRIPSYNTAVRTPAPRDSALIAPTYTDPPSRPSSQIYTESTLASSPPAARTNSTISTSSDSSSTSACSAASASESPKTSIEHVSEQAMQAASSEQPSSSSPLVKDTQSRSPPNPFRRILRSVH
ncbi:uncharacterized protein EI97DRAFT_371539, partial [Westerdykella ornata]